MKLNIAIEKYLKWKSLLRAEKTVSNYSASLRQFAIFSNNCDLEEVLLEDVTEWFILMKEMGYDENTLIPKASALKDFFKYYYHQKYSVVDPQLIPIPKKNYKAVKTINEEQYDLILRSVENVHNDNHLILFRNKAIISLLWDTGIRVSELTSLDINDLNLEKRSSHVATKKSRGARPFRKIFWSRETNIFLKEWLTVKPVLNNTEALFISLDTKSKGKRLTTRSVQRAFNKITSTCELEWVTPHIMRHSKAHRILKGKGSTADVMNVLGHSNLNSSMTYVSMFDDELEERAKLFL
jgi:site-specific recombinase XerD